MRAASTVLWGGLMWATSASCTVGGATDRPDAATGASAPSASAPATASSSEPPPKDWRDAVRAHRWDLATELIDALPVEERDRAELRLARGVAALSSNRHAEAVLALEGLDQKLPTIRDEIQRWYAEAAAVAGPHDAAAKLLERSAKVQDLLLAAQAWQRAGEANKARAVADSAVTRAQRVRRLDDEADAHLVRAAIAEAAGHKAVAAGDYRWFVQKMPRDRRVRDAIAGVDRLGGALPLGERLEALAGSTNQLNVDATLTLLDALAREKPAEAINIKLARARALNAARDYPRAKVAWEAVAALPTGFAAEALYYAARATARLGDMEAAVAIYDDIARRFRKNGFAERAAFRHAETLLVLGRFEEAAASFAQYGARFGKTKSADDARYARAVALLSANKADEARKLLAAQRRENNGRRAEANLMHLEGLAALRADDVDGAKKLWLTLIAEQPLTYPALAAHARLVQLGHTPMPPLIAEPRPVSFAPLPLSLPAAPALLSSVGLDQSAESRLAEMEQDVAIGFPGRESEALCEMYGMLNGSRRRHQIGSRAVSLEVLMRPPTAAERWAWQCVYPHPFETLVQSEEERAELPRGLVYAIMRQESAFKTSAVSPVGAQGLMQLMPNTAKRAADEAGFAIQLDQIRRPDINVRLGAFYLGKLMRGFGGSIPLSAAGYNAGPNATQRWLGAGGQDTDLWIARIPYAETRHYVQRVLGNLARYQWLAGGTAAVTPLALTLPTNSDIGPDAY